jgi:hypothetical protein
MMVSRSTVALGLTSLLFACGGESSSERGLDPSTTTASAGGTGGTGGSPTGGSDTGGASVTYEEPGVTTMPMEPAERTAEREALKRKLDDVEGLTAATLVERYPTTFEPSPTYDLSEVTGLSTIQASSVALEQAELDALAAQGFVISSRWQTPTFMYGYSTLYLEDLPLYVSADSILHAVHHSYDKILKAVEEGSLISELDTLLEGMLSRLASGGGAFAGATARADADVYLTVALSLLKGTTLSPVAGGDATLIAEVLDKANAADGWQRLELFGVGRDEDFSQFVTRGHYTDSMRLGRYFRAMMWLGRTDLRLLETQPDGTQVFRRRQLEAALVLRELVGTELLPGFERIDHTVGAFVGEHDSMQLSELTSLLTDLGVSEAAGVAALDDATIARAIQAGGYGAQRISSHIMINGMDAGTLPLSASFTLLGQRYVLDSHVFSNVVYDRAGGGSVQRMMPNPLDVAFAALGNNQAGALLGEELTAFPYAPDLAAMRVLADAHPPEFWQANLYNHWLDALRTLSPTATREETGEPPVAKTELWSRRLLSTQLASWAELRHDTILYAKQSYTGGDTCEFPDAYVDPYPEFYERIGSYAAFGAALTEELALAPSAPPDLITRLRGHFALVADVSDQLREMAEHELTGTPFTDEMMAFINQAVKLQSICGGVDLENPGWYGQLFLEPHDALEFDPTIADVHTQPTDEGGAPVGRVLHVGTGAPRLMVVINETCTGPRAYAGLASSYFEQITENFERLTDEGWAESVLDRTSPAWLDAVVR